MKNSTQTEHLTLTHYFKHTSTFSDRGIGIIDTTRDQVYSYAVLYEKALCFLSGLQKRGYIPGETIILQIHNTLSFLIAFWGCILGGYIPAPLSIASNEELFDKLTRIWHELHKCDILCDTFGLHLIEKFSRKIGEKICPIEKARAMDSIPVSGTRGRIFPAQSQDIAFIQFSSGSTSHPRGVMLSHGNLVCNIKAISEGIDIKNQDRSLSWLPLTHDLGLIGFHLTPLCRGCHHLLMRPELFLHKPHLWIQKASDYGITVLAAPDSGLDYFNNHFKPEKAGSPDLSGVRLIFCGGEFIHLTHAETFLQLLAPYQLQNNTIFPVYGLAEASLAVTFPLTGEKLRAVSIKKTPLDVGENVQFSPVHHDSMQVLSTGYPVRNCMVRICNSHNKLLAEKKLGFIQIKGPNVMKGYYQQQNRGKSEFTGDGWFNTRDLGFLADKMLYVVGRRQDMVTINGGNVFLHDLERSCSHIKGISMDKIMICNTSSGIVIFIKYKKDLNTFLPVADTIRRHLQAKTGIKMMIILPVKHLSRTSSGKKQRYKAARKYEQGEYDHLIHRMALLSGISPRDESPVSIQHNPTEWLLCKLSEVSSLDTISPDDNFMEIGVNSLVLADIAEKLKSIFPDKIDMTVFFEYPTIRKLGTFLQEE